MSQIIVGTDGSIVGVQPSAYPYIRASSDALRGKRIFVSYARVRRPLVQQISEYLAGFGASTWDYRRDECSIDLDMDRLEESLYQQMSASDAILVVQDSLAYRSVYSTAEAIQALKTYGERTVVVRVVDSFDHTTIGERSGIEPYFS